MRPGQNRRMRGRNNNNNNNSGNRKSPNPLQRSYESNGPDVKVRGTAQHVAEKYLQLARDAQSSGDTVAAESYFQYAEHYYRILLAAQEQMAQQFGHSFPPNRAFNEDLDDSEEEGEDEAGLQQGQPQGGERQQFNGNHVVNVHGQRHEGEAGEGRQRFDRNPRNQERNFDRNQDRNGRRFDRQDRNERRFDRQEGESAQQPVTYAPRPEAQEGAEQPEIAAVPMPVAQAETEQRAPERQPRGERSPRRPRHVPQSDADADAPAGLPAFLTTPTRVPIAITEASASAEGEATASDADSASSENGEPAVKRPRTRRRSPREVMNALGSETETQSE